MPRSRRMVNRKQLRSQQSEESSEAPTEDQTVNETVEETLPNQEQFHDEASETQFHSKSHGGTDHEQSSSLGKKTRTAWEVDVMNEEGVVKKRKLKTIEVWSLPLGERVIVPFDGYGAPISDASALYTGVLAGLAQETSTFPINYSDWRYVPKQYKDDTFNKTIMAKFHFENERVAKKWTLKNLGRKWKDFKCKLWPKFYDPAASRDELISNCPPGIHRDQWSSFVNYRLSEKSMEKCRKNAECRKSQTIPHTSGSKSFARRRAEMENELGRKVDRAEVWLDTHKKKDGTYVNEEARNISERILREMGQSSSSQAQFVSQDDALGKVFGKEHPGRVRALGFGPCPSTAFESTYNATQRPSNDSQMKAYVASLEKELATTKSQLEDMKKTFGGALVTVFQNAFGKVPDQFATWLNQTSEVAPDAGSGHQPPSGNGIQYSSSSHDLNGHSSSS